VHLAQEGCGIGTDPPYVKFTIPAFKGCAFDGLPHDFGLHLALGSIMSW